ncbi:hypothetical protein [Streptomyces canus]
MVDAQSLKTSTNVAETSQDIGAGKKLKGRSVPTWRIGAVRVWFG